MTTEVTSTSSLSRRIDPWNPTGMNAVEAMNIRMTKKHMDRAIARVIQKVEVEGLRDPIAIQNLVRSEMDSYGKLAKRLAVERIRDSVRRGVKRSSALLSVLKINPEQEKMFSLVEKRILPSHMVISDGSTDSIVAELKQKLTRVIIESDDKIVRTKLKEELAGTRNRAAVIASSETLNAFRETTVEVYKFNGIQTVTWFTERDERVCDICRMRHGKRYRLDRVPEAHPHCRCALLADDEQEAS